MQGKMLKTRSIISLLLLLLIAGFGLQAQSPCHSFARNIAKPLLEDFIHDGNYNATYLEEGESAELYKTFYEGQSYRLVVAVVDQLPSARVRLLDSKRNVVFDNANYEMASVWDFVAESTGTMIVQIKLPEPADEANIVGGCIAILFGVENTGRRR